MKNILAFLVLSTVTPACTNFSSRRGHAEYRTPAVTIYDSPKLGKLSASGVLIYDAPESPDAPVYPK